MRSAKRVRLFSNLRASASFGRGEHQRLASFPAFLAPAWSGDGQASPTRRAGADESGEGGRRTTHLSSPLKAYRFFDKTTLKDWTPHGNDANETRQNSYASTSKFGGLLSAFQDAIGAKDAERILELYPELTKLRASGRKVPLRPKELRSAVKLLVLSMRKMDAELANFVINTYDDFAMREIAINKVKAVARTAQLMFHDMKSLWEWEVIPPDIHEQLRVRAASANANSFTPRQALLDLLESRATYGLTAQPEDWYVVLEFAARKRAPQVARAAVRLARLAGAQLDSNCRDRYLQALFTSPRQHHRALKASCGTQQSGFSLLPLSSQSTSSLNMFVKGATNAGLAAEPLVRQAATILHETLLRPTSESAPPLWRSVLDHASMAGKEAGEVEYMFLEAIKHQRLPGCDEDTYHTLLSAHLFDLSTSSSATEEDVVSMFEHLEQLTGISAGVGAYTRGMSSLLGRFSAKQARYARQLWPPAPHRLHEAQLLYERYKAARLPIVPQLVHPLLDAYTCTFVPSMAIAFALYDDLRKALTSPVPSYIHVTLLKGCINARDHVRALKLLQQMRVDGAHLDIGMREKTAISLMNTATSFGQAFDCYRAVHGLWKSGYPSDPHPFTSQGWTSLLDVSRRLAWRWAGTTNEYERPFEKLTRSFRPAEPVPAELIATLFRDMKRTGHRPSSRAITMLLDYFAKAASLLGASTRPVRRVGSTRARLETISSAVMALDHLLQTDGSIEHTMSMLTALMDAHSRIGQPTRVLEIWRRLVLIRAPLTTACLCVMLDTCGFWKHLPDSRRAFKWAREHSPEAVNKNAWDAWLECLCRNNRTEEAIEVAFESMPSGLRAHQKTTSNDIADSPRSSLNDSAIPTLASPDATTFEMLLRFTARDRSVLIHQGVQPSNRKWSDLCQRIQTEYPDVWSEIDVNAIGV
ncbi:hypothetical protein IE81DRAFT_367533 [Ceraceosorus guamensis]|uniref:Pentacotripeptide-repeat region of PRORP domain-containing protein n=1 Tax=Ceraceosorus guamensis TaxID=1522189 RepID=A0A316VWN2_9BASI|nr:hypothetical protein IE81DRAFT_367533 [Ceraceosorus guamensis]PWN41358.1 hypothetical protein IE81DRAFT_367533 [Ceraceosorus guamensis]